MELLYISKKFSTQERCINYLEELRWQGTPICPYCSSTKGIKRKKSIRHKCYDCGRSYSVMIGTIMEATKLPLPKWFMAMGLILNAKKGISSLQLARDLNVNKNTAWYLQQRIRKAMDENDTLLKGVVEADETYVGGSLVNKHQKEKRTKQYDTCGMEHKTPVLGMLQRKGKIVVQVLNKAYGQEIQPILKSSLDKTTELVTDGFGGYANLKDYFSKHIVLNHTKNIRKIGSYHTNTIEGFWSMLKRAIIGQYHKVSSNHLQEYLNEIAFKYNHRNNKNTLETLIMNVFKPKYAT
jgi:transposase-like protein